MKLAQSPFSDQKQRRNASLMTPVAIDVAILTTATTIYTGLAGKFFLLRKMSVCNTTAGTITLSIIKASNTWLSSLSIAANTTVDVVGFSDILLPDAVDMAATASATGLQLFAWGLQVEGGDTWTL